MSKKSDVIGFVYNCSRKAEKSLIKGYLEHFENLMNPEDYRVFMLMFQNTAYKLSQDSIFLGVSTSSNRFADTDVADILLRYQSEFGIPDAKYPGVELSRSECNYFYNSVPTENMLPTYLRYVVHKQSKSALAKLIVTRIQEFTAVRKEYEKLKDTLNELPSASQGIELLESLGFDVTVLRDKTKIVKVPEPFNKELIFVCGDNK